MMTVAASGADTMLAFVCLALHLRRELADVQVAFVTCQHIGIDAFFTRHVIVLHQVGNLRFQYIGVQSGLVEPVVEAAPVQAFHFLAILRKRQLHPLNHRAEVHPQRVGILVVLMLGHVALDALCVAVFRQRCRYPSQCRLQIVLPDGRAVHIVAPQSVGRTTRLREVALGIGQPRPGKHGITQLLVRQPFAGNVDGAEPVQLFLIRTAAHVHLQFVVQYLVLLLLGQVVEKAEEERKIAVHVLAYADGPLLPVHHFVGHFGVILASRPIHHVQRKTFAYRVYHRIALLVIIDKLALVGRTDVQLPAQAAHAAFLIVHVTRRQFPDRYFP